jgi:GST-like protein
MVMSLEELHRLGCELLPDHPSTWEVRWKARNPPDRAILIYTAEKSGKFIPTDPAARSAFWQALMSASTDMTPTLGAIFQIVRSKEPHGPSADLFKGRWKQYLKVWDDRLGKQKYAAGNEVTIADFSLYAGYARAKGSMPELCEGFPNVARWADEMAARPAIQRALKF